MNVLPSTGPDPVGAAALLAHADSAELERFQRLEDAVWGQTSLSPAVVETVRLRCAQLRGCEFCKAVRVAAAIEDGLSEAKVALLGSPDARGELDAAQLAALDLVERFLRDPCAPGERRARDIAGTLGTRGVMEVLLACAAFATAELRIALGDNRPPVGDGVVERRRGAVAKRSSAAAWPALTAAVLDPDAAFTDEAPGLAGPVHGLVRALWAGDDLAPDIVAALILRSAQLQGVADDDPVNAFLVPPRAARLANAADVRNWPAWPDGVARHVLALAEQVWIDPAAVDRETIEPIRDRLGVDGLIRVTWDLIWIAQLHRLALVLHRRPGSGRRRPAAQGRPPS